MRGPHRKDSRALKLARGLMTILLFAASPAEALTARYHLGRQLSPTATVNSCHPCKPALIDYKISDL